MLRCMLGSVKGENNENPQGKGEFGNEKERNLKELKNCKIVLIEYILIKIVKIKLN